MLNKLLPSLLTAREGSTPNNFCKFCLVDMVHKTYKKMNEQSVKSSPFKLRCDNPLIQLMGSNGNLATTRPSNLRIQILKIKISFCDYKVWFTWSWTCSTKPWKQNLLSSWTSSWPLRVLGCSIWASPLGVPFAFFDFCHPFPFAFRLELKNKIKKLNLCL